MVNEDTTMTAADRIRAALERLVTLDEAHESDRQWEPWLNALAAARAALDAAPADGPAVPEGREPASVAGEPSDEELLELTEDWPSTTDQRHDLSGCPEVPLYSVFADEVVDFARAVLARWSRPAPAPAEPEISAEEAAMIAAPWSYLNHPPAPAGEVAELVRWLRLTGEGQPRLSNEGYARLTRIADLLERQASPPAKAPAEGLASELAAWLRGRAAWFALDDPTHEKYVCAADLLERQAVPVLLPRKDAGELALMELERTVVLLMPVTGHKKIKRFATIRAALKRLQELENKADLNPAPVPVAVSERLPQPEDCDAEGQVWVSHEPPEWDELTCWTLMAMDKAMMWAPVAFWLPAHALPLPTTESQP